MKTIKVYATSANLGPGFDTFGICLDLYNEYHYEEAPSIILEGFEDRFLSENENAVIDAYKRTFEKANESVVGIHLIQVINDIPPSRGLGSSAACCVAGIMIANDFLHKKLSKEEIFNLASSIEGHPDNVAPLLFGGFTMSYKVDEAYQYKKYPVNTSLRFFVAIPYQELKTETARKVLPSMVLVKTAVNNITSALLLVDLLTTGNIDENKNGILDLLHEPYRIPLIEGAKELREIVKSLGGLHFISGAGSTQLIISKDNILEEVREKMNASFTDYIFKEVHLIKKGVLFEE